LQDRMTSGRDLSRGNPHADALTRDFARLGRNLCGQRYILLMHALAGGSRT